MKLQLVALFVLISTNILSAQNKDLIRNINRVADDCSFFEVTEEMFKAIGEDKRYANNPQISQISEIRFLMFIECPGSRVGFYEDFASETDLDEYHVMMRSKDQREQFTFFKKKQEDVNEYLLLHNQGLTYLVTTLNISTINELQAYIKMAASIGTGK